MNLSSNIAHLLALMLISGPLRADETPPLTLRSALYVAVQDNPDLAQIRARSDALAALPSQVGTLPDPMISIGALNFPVDTFDTRQEPMTQIQLGLSQTIPFPGKLRLREQAAEYEATAALQNVTEATEWLRSHVKKTWWQLFFLDRALQVVANNQMLLRQFIRIATTKYEVGEGLQQDVLLAQLELSQLLDRQLKLEGERRIDVARLNALLDKSADRPVSLPETVDDVLPELLAEQDLYRQAGEVRAVLAAKRDAVHAAETRLDLAKKDYYPDFTIGAAYGIRDTTLNGADRADFFSMKLSMNVPIFAASKQSKAVDQRTSELLQHKYDLQDQWNKVRSQISQAYSDYRRAKDQYLLFKTGIIPQARQTVASMLAGYQVSKVDFLNLVRSQVTLFNYEVQYWLAFTEANQAMAQLIAAVGREEIYE